MNRVNRWVVCVACCGLFGCEAQNEWESGTDEEHLGACLAFELDTIQIWAALEQSATAEAWVSNSCGREAPLTLETRLTADAGGFEAESVPKALGPGESAAVTIRYTAIDGVVRNGSLELSTPDDAVDSAVLNLEGAPIRDVDGDGYEDVRLGGEDCDDQNAEVSPSATEIWYDGIDQNCDGANDFDQDGDGVEAQAYGGEDCDDLDETVHPEAAEIWYDGVDQNCDGLNDFDQDGDGYEAEVSGGEDCLDTDPLIHPDADETWADGMDNDCNGLRDDFDVVDLQSGYVEGAKQDYISHGGLGFGDVDNDGVSEFIIGAKIDDYAGRVHAVEASTLGTTSASVFDYQDFDFVGSDFSFSGAVSRAFGDNTGDGQTDFTVAGADVYTGGIVLVFDGSAKVPTTLEESDALLTITDGVSYDPTALASHLDLNGDGTAEIVFGAQHESPNSNRYAGIAYIYDTDGLKGTVSFEDADSALRGDSAHEFLGTGVGGGDIDGDGYDDLLVGAPGRNSNTGAWHVITGGSSLPADKTASAVADIIITGTTSDQMGREQHPVVADFDHDGLLDLAVSGTANSTVYVFSDVSRLSGKVAASTADWTLKSSKSKDWFGLSLVSGDLDGDGMDDLLVGAPGHDYIGSTAMTGGPGSVYLYLGSTLKRDNRSFSGEKNADGVIKGRATSDVFGHVLLAQDFDGDGRDDLAVGAPNDSVDLGRVSIITSP